MKFGKEMRTQMVEEWRDAYVNYNLLKSILKDLLHFRESVKPPPPRFRRTVSLYRSFSGLSNRYTHHRHQDSSLHQDNDRVILVNHVQQDGMEEYETELLMSSDEGAEYEKVFFKRLHLEFNKVNLFYKTKVEEMMSEAASLDKQMETLISMRIIVEKPSYGSDKRPNNSDYFSTKFASSKDALGDVSNSGNYHMDVTIEDAKSGEITQNPDSILVRPKKYNRRALSEKWNGLVIEKVPIENFKKVEINITPETPHSTIKAFLMDPKNKDLHLTRQGLKKTEKLLRRAFIEFHLKLLILKNYRALNLLAFSKIMKKYDKIAERHVSRSYLVMVDRSYLGSFEEVIRLLERVEATFIKHFANSNRAKGMRALRLQAKKENYKITFSLGFFTGCVLALLMALSILIHARKILNNHGGAQYMENIFPLYSMFGFIILHMLMYAANLYFWRCFRVNYPFIFGFKQGSELGYREVLLLSNGLTVLSLASVVSNLYMKMNPETKDYQALTELIPLGLFIFILLLLSCPLNIVFRSSRFFLLRSVWRCISAPLYKVSLVDFFLMDQLTSQVQAIRTLEYYICYYDGSGDFKHRKNSCSSSEVYTSFFFILGVIPYWGRFVQCLRRLYEEKDSMQGYNALKYFSTIIAVVTRTAFTLQKQMSWMVMAQLSSAIATIISTYWDIVIDWGLLQRHSRNRWLRDRLLIPHKSIYFGAMALNIILRFAWLQSVLDFKIPRIHGKALVAIVAYLEILRRGLWNFFRLENEHLNNVGKYRAFKSVPLPFQYDDEEMLCTSYDGFHVIYCPKYKNTDMVGV
ncbi:hypothetical protein AMTRI_Chr04g253560 [Amborella trichopoda]